MMVITLVMSLALIHCFASVSNAQTFTGLGIPPGYQSSEANDVSSDGSVVVGNSENGSSGGLINRQAFRWERGVMTPLGKDIHARAVSADGSVIVGSIVNAGAFRWASGVMTQLPHPENGGEGARASAWDVSADGSVVAGEATCPYYTRAMRWENGVTTCLEVPPEQRQISYWGRGVSDDGRVVVGQMTEGAFRWEGGVYEALPTLGTAGAYAVSSDGSVIVGFDNGGAIRWKRGVRRVIVAGGSAAAVSADGSVVVGGSIGGAFIWDPLNGTRNLKQLLTDHFGLNLSGWTLPFARAVSPDGSSIVGTGYNPSGQLEGWVAAGITTCSDAPFRNSATQQSLTVITSPQAGPIPAFIEARFTPTDGRTLEQLAADCGFHHFNWLQYVVEDEERSNPLLCALRCSGLKDQNDSIPEIPYLDPPLGGYASIRNECRKTNPTATFPVQDNLPFYWDEQFHDLNCTIGAPTMLARNTDSPNRTLIFSDAPASLGKLSFLTLLAGVFPDGSGVVVNVSDVTLKWTYTPNGLAPDTISIRNIDPALAGNGMSAPAGHASPSEVLGLAPQLARDGLAVRNFAPRCGNGNLEEREECDDGNTRGGDCCSSTCQYEGNGSACTTDGLPCTFDQCNATGTCQHTASGDADGDSICDAADPCVNAAGARDFLASAKPRIVLSKINSDLAGGGNDIAVIKGEFISATSFASLDPQTNGARVVIQNAAGGTEVDVTLAPGTFGGKGTRGWKANAKVSKWTFLDKTGAPSNGFLRFVMIDQSKKAPKQVKVMASGKNGTYSIVSGDEPVRATVVLGGQPASLAGQCGESAYGVGNCTFNRKLNSLTCRK